MSPFSFFNELVNVQVGYLKSYFISLSILLLVFYVLFFTKEIWYAIIGSNMAPHDPIYGAYLLNKGVFSVETKRIIALGLSAVCLVGLLCGCKGKDTQTDDGATTSSVAVDVEHGDEALKEIKSLNDPLALLEQFKTVEVDSSIHDKTGTEISHITIQYTRNDDGYLQTATHLKYNASDYATPAIITPILACLQARHLRCILFPKIRTTWFATRRLEFESMVDKELICWFTDTTDTVQNVTDQDGFKTVEVKSVPNEDDTY